MKKYFIALCLVLLGMTAALGQSTPPDGKYRSVYPSGNTDETGRYVNGVKTGMWYKYTEKGTVLRKQKWNNGRLRWQVDYENGHRARITDSKGNTKILPACGCS
ncbi:MAG: toxin-antitoxin system YwqK family antitoxin [Bacteroidota bacterium]|jgi:antitoxin component YwqK of YwqJK toxin-antitoxin module